MSRLVTLTESIKAGEVSGEVALLSMKAGELPGEVSLLSSNEEVLIHCRRYASTTWELNGQVGIHLWHTHTEDILNQIDLLLRLKLL